MKYAVLLFLAVFTTANIDAQTNGQNQQKPKDIKPLGLEIGGTQTVPRPAPPRDFADIFGAQTMPKLASFTPIGGQRVPGGLSPMVEIGGNQSKPEPRGGMLPDIGGPSVPRTGGMGIVMADETEIGGAVCAPRHVLAFNPIGGSPGHERRTLKMSSPLEIGGQTVPGGRPFSGMLENGVAIGGNQGVPRIPLIFFPNEDLKVAIGVNQSLPRDKSPLGSALNVMDIGGQSAPRTACGYCVGDIGGAQTAPRV